MTQRELNELLGPMKRAELMSWAVRRHEENVRLQNRIANQRATYRRFYTAVQKVLAEHRQRREETSVPHYVPRNEENRTRKPESERVRFQ